MVYVYAIKSLHRNYIYVGQTENVLLRFHQHNNREEKSTKPYSPFLLIFSMQCDDRIEARKWEKFYKTGEGKSRLRVILAELCQKTRPPADAQG
ncbi:endonuclease [Sphingobacteriaceae bacterium]|nr:endonuclease [Sphingobacteriaceae bacterium]